jgi:uncharacterized protein YdeI (YjbR/CyaY-like superfamily)
MISTDNFIKVEVKSTKDLRNWLTANHNNSESVWLVTFKKHVDDKYISTSQVLDELLCFGWIDGIRRKLDEDRTMQLISPRKTQYWSKTYKDRVAKLRKEGKMTRAGEKVISESKRLGLWNFMDDVDALMIPDDFQVELRKNPPSEENFNAFGDSQKRFTLRWIKLAKTELTRSKRIKQAARLAAENKKIPGI